MSFEEKPKKTRKSSAGIGKDQNSEQSSLTFFDLSSHKRARQAIRFGLKMHDYGFHIFVSGEERSGRMTATLAYLKKHIQNLPPPKDWVYLNNFKLPHRPKPYFLPNGKARKLKDHLNQLIDHMKVILDKTLNHPTYLKKIDQLNTQFHKQIEQELQKIQSFAEHKGYSLQQEEEGFDINIINPLSHIPSETNLEDIKYRLERLSLQTTKASEKLEEQIEKLKRDTAQKALSIPLKKFKKEYGPYLGSWIEDFIEDVLEHIDTFLKVSQSSSTGNPLDLKEWYGVNILADNGTARHPSVILESRPTYENLFGSIKYRTGSAGNIETNFTMIRPGALHLVNEGILVLRAENIASNSELWEPLKAALRDRSIRIEEPARENSLPLLDAPEPYPIPLKIQVVLIGSPYWYYNFFFNDPDFLSYFKIKADIDADLPATLENVKIYRSFIEQSAVELTGLKIEEDAVDTLLYYSARQVGDFQKLTARFELITDILYEAFALKTDQETLTQSLINAALQQRLERNSAVEEKSFQEILDKKVLIQLQGTAIGQANGLSVLSTGDHHYGLPCRISARTYAGNKGVLNIERLTDLGGPIQQKGAFILEGFLNALFAQDFPLSYTCSLTFEQNYFDVEGDSASMAELMAIFSSLSGIPLRQDIAITGSMNQFGCSQPVGGIHYKIEGFHQACKAQGLTETQGVIIPRSNLINLTLRDNVLQDIQDKKFFIWPVESVFEAIELMTGYPCGLDLENGLPKTSGYPSFHFKPQSIFDKIAQQLKKYHLSLHPKTESFF